MQGAMRFVRRNPTLAIGGLLLGLVAGYIRRLDAAIMRVMDGLMAIPTMLLAIVLAYEVGRCMACRLRSMDASFHRHATQPRVRSRQTSAVPRRERP